MSFRFLFRNIYEKWWEPRLTKEPQILSKKSLLERKTVINKIGKKSDFVGANHELEEELSFLCRFTHNLIAIRRKFSKLNHPQNLYWFLVYPTKSNHKFHSKTQISSKEKNEQCSLNTSHMIDDWLNPLKLIRAFGYTDCLNNRL